MSLKMSMKKEDMIRMVMCVCADADRTYNERLKIMNRCQHELEGKQRQNASNIAQSLKYFFTHYEVQGLRSRFKRELIEIYENLVEGVQKTIDTNKLMQTILDDEHGIYSQEKDAILSQEDEEWAESWHKCSPGIVEPVSIQKSVDAQHVGSWRKSTLEMDHKSEELLEGDIDWEALAEYLHGGNNAQRILENKTFQNLYCHPIDKDCEECGNPFSVILAPDVTVQQAEELNAGIKICKDCNDKKFGVEEQYSYFCEHCGDKFISDVELDSSRVCAKCIYHNCLPYDHDDLE